MAEKTVSQLTSFVKENSPVRIDLAQGQTPVVSSVDVARHFQKKHKHVLAEIRKIISISPKSFTGPNFRPSEYTDSTGRTLTAFLLSRDAFSVLAMGFTGKAAIMWKLRYIEAFNQMEGALRESPQERLTAVARSIYALSPVKKRRLRSAVRFRQMGLGIQSIAKLLDSDNREISRLLKAAVVLGFLEPALGVGASREMGVINA